MIRTTPIPIGAALVDARWRERLRGMGPVAIAKRYLETAPGDRFTLKPAEEKLVTRWMTARSLFLQRHEYGDVKRLLMEEFKISARAAECDIRNARDVWAHIDDTSLDMHRSIAIKMSLDAYRMAEKQQDPDAMSRATTQYMAATGLDKQKPEGFDIEKIQADKVYVEALDPAIRDFLLQLIQSSGGVINAAGLFNSMGESIDYETLNAPSEAAE